MKEKKKMIAIKMALGLSVNEIGFHYFMEVLIVVIMVTHDVELCKYGSRIIEIVKGKAYDRKTI